MEETTMQVTHTVAYDELAQGELVDHTGPMAEEHIPLAVSVMEQLGCIMDVCEWQAYRADLLCRTKFFHGKQGDEVTTDPEAWVEVDDVDMVVGNMYPVLLTRAKADHKLWLQEPNETIKQAVDGDFDEDAERARLRPV